MKKIDLSFVKVQANGNDFILIDSRDQRSSLPETPRLSRFLCDRHFGVGADGVLELRHAQKENAFASVIIWNSDGSRAKMCGNGMRCIGNYLHKKGELPIGKSVALDVEGRLVSLTSHVDPSTPNTVEIEVDLGVPSFEGEGLPDKARLPWGSSYLFDNKEFFLHALSLGNPHVVLFTKEDPGQMIASLGSALSRDERFLQGVNVGVVRVFSLEHLEVVVYERGAGLTLACGSGACAAVIVSAINRLIAFDKWVKVKLPGGQVKVRVRSSDYRVSLMGSAEEVFYGTSFVES